jgi:hypothetical protein
MQKSADRCTFLQKVVAFRRFLQKFKIYAEDVESRALSNFKAYSLDYALTHPLATHIPP